MKPTSLSEQLTAKAKERAEKEKEARRNAEKLQIEMRMKAEKKRQERELREQMIRDEEKLKKQREEERIRKEREAKTRNYFVLNQYNRKVPAPDEPVYYGDMVNKFGSWVPHGKGQFSLNDKVKMEGDYIRGDFMSGTIHYENGYTWNGLVLDYKMHGVGIVTKHTLVEKVDSDDESMGGDDSLDTSVKIKREVVYSPLDISRAAVAYENNIICYQDEMILGRQVEFTTPIFDVYPAGEDGRSPRGVIVEKVKDWQFVIRFHDEVAPKQRVIDFANVSKFRLLKESPLIHNMNTYGVLSEPTLVYDHRPQPMPVPIDNHKDIDRKISIQKQINRRAQILGLLAWDEIPEDMSESQLDEDDVGDDDVSVNSSTTRTTAVSQITTATGTSSQMAAREEMKKYTLAKGTYNKKPSNYYSKRLIDPFPLRKHTEHSINMFESRAVGVGAAKEEEEKVRFEQLKKEQWAALIADKRAAFEAQRQREIEEQSKAALQVSLDQQRKLTEAKIKEAADDEEETRSAVERELKKLDTMSVNSRVSANSKLTA